MGAQVARWHRHGYERRGVMGSLWVGILFFGPFLESLVWFFVALLLVLACTFRVSIDFIHALR